MKRLFVFTLIFWGIFSSIQAQTFGNEWINYSQKYYGFPITQTGIHKLSYQELMAAGVPVTTIPLNTYQVFGRQKELPLYIPVNGNNVLDPN